MPYRKRWTQEEITSLFALNGCCALLMDFSDGSQRVCVLPSGHPEERHEQALLPDDPSDYDPHSILICLPATDVSWWIDNLDDLPKALRTTYAPGAVKRLKVALLETLEGQ